VNPLPSEPSSTESSESTRGGPHFRIVHLLYVIAVIASSLATFGVGGVVPAAFLVGFWSAVFTSRSRPKAFRAALLVSLLFGCLICCMLPAVQSAREAARRSWCMNNLKQIAVALHNYHDVYGSFPPAYVAGDDGMPLHSWRVLILPFIEERTLYDQYDFDESWDGPNNRQLLSQMPDVYACPSARDRRAAPAAGITSYVAVVDPHAAWQGAQARSMADIVDGTSRTALLIEAAGLGIPWMKPDDAGLATAIEVLTSVASDAVDGHCSEDFFYVYSVGHNVALVDSSVHFVHHGAAPENVRRLLLIDDGQAWDDDPPASERPPSKRAKLDNWFRLALFLLIAVFPTPWVWLHPQEY
jgi:hypothetical protein